VCTSPHTIGLKHTLGVLGHCKYHNWIELLCLSGFWFPWCGTYLGLRDQWKLLKRISLLDTSAFSTVRVFFMIIMLHTILTYLVLTYVSLEKGELTDTRSLLYAYCHWHSQNNRFIVLVIVVFICQCAETCMVSSMTWWNCLRSEVIRRRLAICFSETMLIVDTLALRLVSLSHPHNDRLLWQSV